MQHLLNVWGGKWSFVQIPCSNESPCVEFVDSYLIFHSILLLWADGQHSTYSRSHERESKPSSTPYPLVMLPLVLDRNMMGCNGMCKVSPKYPTCEFNLILPCTSWHIWPFLLPIHLISFVIATVCICFAARIAPLVSNVDLSICYWISSYHKFCPTFTKMVITKLQESN
jgi:hypothetical protein